MRFAFPLVLGLFAQPALTQVARLDSSESLTGGSYYWMAGNYSGTARPTPQRAPKRAAICQ
jgi:hypothetical protein